MNEAHWRNRDRTGAPRRARAVRAMVALMSLTLVAQALPRSPEPATWNEVPVPGGAAGLARVVGLEPDSERWRVLYEVTRQAHAPYGEQGVGQRLPRALSAYFAALTPAPPVPSVRRAAFGGGRERGETRLTPAPPAERLARDERLPLPLPEVIWAQVLLERPPGPEGLLAALLVDRPAALLYRGLATLDDETLQALARDQATLRQWRDAAPTFSIFARSLSVRAGRVQVPGGEAYAPLWEQAVGERVQRPARFALRLAQRAEGRWFSLFDALHQSDELQRRALLGAPGSTPRRAAFEALATGFLAQPAWWQPGGRPYARPFPDPALVLLALPCDDAGLALPGTRAFWEQVFDDDALPEQRDDTWRAAERGPQAPIDAAWLVARVAVDDKPVAQARLQSVRLAARVFRAAVPSQALLTSLRATRRYPALLAALEELGFTSPDDFATALRRAQALDRLPDGSRQVALAQFQGALALLQRVTRQHGLSRSEAQPLARALFDLVAEREHGYAGRLLEHIETRLLPRLVQSVYGSVPPDSAERTLLRALAGARLDLPPGPALEWEGLPYRVDAPAAELRRLHRLRALQAGPTLDDALALGRATRELEAIGSREPRRVAEWVARACAWGDALRGESRARVARTGRATTEADSADVAALAPFRALRALPSGRVAEAVGLLREAADVLAADALQALAYLPHLGAPEGPALLGGHVARRHDFGVQDALGPGPWQWPEEVSGARVRWHARGALLGLQEALARLSLRRLERELPARPPRLYEPARAAGARAAAALVAADLTDAQRDALAAALGAGRARVMAAAQAPERLAELGRAARLPAWRARLLPWIGMREPEALTSAFTLVELLRLGDAHLSADAWGVPAPLALGSEGLHLDARAWDANDLVGVSPLELAAGRATVDLHLRVAELLAELRLPASLLPAILAAAVLDFQEEAQPAYPEDQLALSRQAAALTRERVEDYVAALALEGPLVPLEEAPTRARPPAASTGGRP
jgi:hypothetical protein